MKQIGLTKIGKQTARPGKSYAIVRLPQDYSDLAGSSVILYDSSSESRKSITLVFDTDVAQHVAQHCAQDVKFTANESIIDLENRIKLLEKSINQKSTAESSDSAIGNGLEEIRTPDLRHVKATS